MIEGSEKKRKQTWMLVYKRRGREKTFFPLQTQIVGTGEMTRLAKVIAAPADDPCLVFHTHRAFSTISNWKARESQVLLLSPWAHSYQ